MVTKLYHDGVPVRGVWLGDRLQYALHKGGEKVWPPAPDVHDTFNRTAGTLEDDYRTTVLADNPDVYFALDDASGDFAALAGTAATATATWSYQQPTLVHEGVNSAQATSTAAQGDFGTQLSSTTNLTLSLWFKPTSVSSTASIIEVGGAGDGVQVTVEAGGKVGLYSAAMDIKLTSNRTLEVGIATHIAAVHDSTGDTLSLYIDGVLDTATNPVGGIGGAAGSSEGTFGAGGASVASMSSWTGVTNAAQGYYDEIAGWRSALSGAAIEAHYDAAFSSSLGSTEVGGLPWSEAGVGDLSIDSNEVASDTGDVAIGFVETGNADGVVAAHVRGDGASSVIFRYVDDYNYWELGRFTDFANAYLDKVVDGVATNVFNASFAGHEYLYAYFQGDTISVYSSTNSVDLDLAVAFTDETTTSLRIGTTTDSTHNTATKHGFRLREVTTRCNEFRYWYPLQ